MISFFSWSCSKMALQLWKCKEVLSFENIFTKNYSLVYLEGKVTPERHRERNLPSPELLPKCYSCQGYAMLNQESRNPGLPHWWQVSKHMGPLSTHISRKPDLKQSRRNSHQRFYKGCQCCKLRPNHNTNCEANFPTVQSFSFNFFFWTLKLDSWFLWLWI